jgi:hypothetical protein
MNNILVKDDANPLVEFTLLPIADDPATWRASVAGVPLEGQARLTIQDIEVLKDGNSKVTARLEVPVMETLGASGSSAGYVAPPKVAYVDTVIVTAFWNKRSTTADRANALKMMMGCMSGASAVTATGILDQSSAADAWKNSTAVGPSTFISVVNPT